MRLLNRVAWSEGLLMAPQHMQCADAYHESLLATRLQAIAPDCWGVLRIEVDTQALGRGALQLTRFIGILPDGTCLELSAGSPDLPASRALQEHFPHTRASLPVYLALPRERAGVDNFAIDAAGATRYRVGQLPAHDLSGGDDTVDVPVARPAPMLLLGEEARQDMVSVQVLELVRADAGTFVVSDPFIPPCLRVDASAFLMAALRRLLQAMTTRQRTLSEGRRQRSGSQVEFRAEEVTSFLMLGAINSYLPSLQHVVDSGDMPPRQAYLLLTQLAGMLSTFAVDVDPCAFPKYRYDDLRGTFEELFARIMSMLNATIDERCVSIALEGDGAGMYRGALESRAELFECTRFFLAVKTDMPEEQTASQLPQLSKVASWQDVQNILSAATPGARVQVDYQPPPEVPIKAGLLYFALDTSNAYWRNIMADRQLAVYLPPLFDPPQTTVQLLGIKTGG